MDPLALGGLDVDALAARNAPAPKPTNPVGEAALAKEKRLAAREERLAAKETAVAASKEPVKPEVGSQDQKSKLLDKLGAYRERFPSLKKRNTVSVKSSIDDINDEIHYCEMQLGSKPDSGIGASLIVGLAAGFENMTHNVYNPLNLNLTGLTKVTQDNIDQFTPIVDELMIKYGAGMVVSPETRLVLAFGSVVYTCPMANTGDPRIAAAMHKMHQSASKMPAAKDL